MKAWLAQNWAPLVGAAGSGARGWRPPWTLKIKSVSQSKPGQEFSTDRCAPLNGPSNGPFHGPDRRRGVLRRRRWVLGRRRGLPLRAPQRTVQRSVPWPRPPAGGPPTALRVPRTAVRDLGRRRGSSDGGEGPRTALRVLIGQYKYCPKRQKYMAFFEVPSILAQEAWRPKYSAPKKGVVYSRSKAYFWSQVHRR